MLFVSTTASKDKNPVAHNKARHVSGGDTLLDVDGDSAVDQVLTKDLVSAMQAADFEAAAVSAAVAMEKNAIKLYGTRAAEASDPEEKALYEWLTQWEKSHLTFLADLEAELTQKVWFDQNFWPF